MKVRINILKAPWPSGARVGDVAEIGPVIPAWAVGKCEPAGDDAEVTIQFDQPTEFVTQLDVSGKALDLLRAEHDAALQELSRQHVVALEDLRAQFDAEVAKNAALQERFDGQAAELVKVREQLQAAEAKAAKPATGGKGK